MYTEDRRGQKEILSSEDAKLIEFRVLESWTVFSQLVYLI